ncbi:MAG: 1-deoxy-D-xylulose 5-phosphate synthase, partial [Planctomycetaceae bacterium]|nr:1-deoxy-D-xylulose 5-phosphate synthase [Planctomycetaceae bacterium]
TLIKAIQESGFVVTVEENTLLGGFGSAVLELANDHGINTSHIRRLGIPDRFIMHGERSEQLADIGLDVAGIVSTAKAMSQRRDFCLTEGRAFAG